MKRDIEETAARFDDMSERYDEERSTATVDTAMRVVKRTLDRVDGTEIAVDIGAGTGAVSLALAPAVAHVYALDISAGMLERAREKATENYIENVTFERGTFRAPRENLDIPTPDVVVSNFAMHHLADGEKEAAITTIRELLGDRGRFVLGDVIIFEEEAVSADHYDPEVDDPATVETLVELFETNGFTTEHERVGPMAGVVEGRLTADSP